MRLLYALEDVHSLQGVWLKSNNLLAHKLSCILGRYRRPLTVAESLLYNRCHAMQLSTQPSLGFAPFNNRNLFAEHFLQKVLPTQAQWQEAEGVDEAFAAMQKLWSATQHFTNKTNEAQTENDLIKPVFDLLWGSGCYQVQPRIPNVDVQRQPDYALFLSAEERTAAQPRINTMEYWRDVPALADAKKWSASLDKERSADENPSAQVCNYLYRSRVRWGILSNGRTWRLYEREKSSAGGTYFEVDLADIMLREDRAAFKHFYLFFRRESLVTDASGVSFLEMVFRGSVQYAAAVGNSLKESVYDALRHLMNGFFEHSANALDRNDADTLRLVHQNSLIVLYRLLFLLYAEDRDLLPCEQEPYKDHSLRKLQKEINNRLRAQGTYLPHMTGIWGQLCNLFTLIDEGYPEGGIPAYNGGLFSPAKYPAIAHTPSPPSPLPKLGEGWPQALAAGRGEGAPWKIGDRRIAQVIDLLAYERKPSETAGSHDIDYRTLDVQHLGSIYEGLLELQPHVAPETLVEVVEDKKAVFKPKSSAPLPMKAKTPREVAAHEIYLVTNRGERKASGSYYTPKYIVDYIVENTLGPLTDAAAEGVKTLRPEVDVAIKEVEGRRRKWQAEAGRGDAAAAIEIQKADAAIEAQKRRLLEPYLSLKVLDPAMGSGHFLVGAADFLSLAMATDPCLLALDESEEDPQLSFKRAVVERSLYGVDLNPLSVELAKLSLWLHTVSRDKALSFLDHHLRAGNSLIGARLEDDLMKEPPQFNAKGKRIDKNSEQLVLGLYDTLTKQHLVYLLDVLRQIMETPSGDAETEHLKDRLYREMDARREQFRAVANCWLAPYFGVPVSHAHYQSAVEALSEGEDALHNLAAQSWFQDAQGVAEAKRFFHWELEFPEVFLSPHGLKPSAERGFDAVVGNPPWGATLSAEDKEFFKTLGTDTSTPNSYIYFVRQGELLLRSRQCAGFIVPDSVLVKDYAKTRCSLINENTLLHVVYLQDAFEDVNHDSTVIIFKRAPREGDTLLVGIIPRQETSIMPFLVSLRSSDFDNPELEYRFNLNLSNLRVADLYYRLSPLQKLGDIGEFHEGIHTGNMRDKLFFTSKPSYRNIAKVKPCLIGSSYGDEFGRYFYSPNGNWTIYDSALIDKNTTDYASLRDENIFVGPKLYVTRTGDDFYSFYDEEHYASNNLFSFKFKKPNSEFSYFSVMALMNSNFAQRVNRLYLAPRFGDLFTETKIIHLELLPLPRINFTTPETQRARLLDKAKQLYEGTLAKGDGGAILGFVQKQLNAAPERADVVHDLLALLAERMIALNTAKQEEVKSFLTWLERRLKSPIDAMANKTKIKDYHSADFGALQAVLK